MGVLLWLCVTCAGSLCHVRVPGSSQNMAGISALSLSIPRLVVGVLHLSSSVGSSCWHPHPLLPQPPGETLLVAAGDGCRCSAATEKPCVVQEPRYGVV